MHPCRPDFKILKCLDVIDQILHHPPVTITKKCFDSMNERALAGVSVTIAGVYKIFCAMIFDLECGR